MTRISFMAIAIIASLLLLSCKETQSETTPLYFEQDVPHALLGDNVKPKEYRLDMVINPDEGGFSGVVEIDIKLTYATQQIWLHGKNMTVENAVLIYADKTIPVQFQELPASEAPSGIAKITAEETMPAGNATLRLPYETPYNLNLNSAYKVERGEDAYIVTQFEPLGAREAFPSFDEPRFKVPFTLSITAPDDDFVYANTPEVLQKSDGAGWTRYEFAKTLPLPTYLIAFGVGPYDVVEYADLPATDVRDRR